MPNQTDLWKFVADHLRRGKNVMLLVVAESSGSSPGRAGFKMAVAADGELIGSIGGGVMEVELVDRAKTNLCSAIIEQVHRENVPNASGMICSGKQTVIVKKLSADDLDTVQKIICCLNNHEASSFEISNFGFEIVEGCPDGAGAGFTRIAENKFLYREAVGDKYALFIIGGGHCGLALSELMSKLGFRISIFDDRPSLNTLKKNEFADEITAIDGYDTIADHIPKGKDIYVVVMTLGYASDAVVIRQLIDHDVKYLGVLGSRAKMATLIKELKDEGFDAEKLARIHTPIGLPINSHSPEEIAVSIAAEIIAVKNA